MNFGKHITKSNKRKLSNQKKDKHEITNKMQLFFLPKKDSAKPTKPTAWLTITKHLTVVTAQKNAVGKTVHLRNLHCTEFCLCKQVIFKTSTAKNSG